MCTCSVISLNLTHRISTASESLSFLPTRVVDINIETAADFFNHGLIHLCTTKWWHGDESRYKYLIIHVPLLGFDEEDVDAVKMKIEGNIVLLDVPMFPHHFDSAKHRNAYSKDGVSKDRDYQQSLLAVHDKVSRYMGRQPVVKRFHINMGEKYKQVKVKGGNESNKQIIPDIISDYTKIINPGSSNTRRPINHTKFSSWKTLHSLLEKGLKAAGVESLDEMRVYDSDDDATTQKKQGNIDKFEVEMKRHSLDAIKFPVATEKIFVLKSIKSVDSAMDDELARYTVSMALSDSDSG